MEINETLRDALVLKYQGDIATAKANISVYLTSPVAVSYTHLTLPTILLV